MPHTDIPIIGKSAPALLEIRLRDAKERYKQTFHHTPPTEELSGQGGWAQVVWLDQAVATRNMPKGLSTYTPPAPYRTFRLLAQDVPHLRRTSPSEMDEQAEYLGSFEGIHRRDLAQVAVGQGVVAVYPDAHLFPDRGAFLAEQADDDRGLGDIAVLAIERRVQISGAHLGEHHVYPLAGIQIGRLGKLPQVAGDERITGEGTGLGYIGGRDSARKQAGVFDLDAVVEDAYLDVAVQAVIAVDHRVGDGLFDHLFRVTAYSTPTWTLIPEQAGQSPVAA